MITLEMIQAIKTDSASYFKGLDVNLIDLKDQKSQNLLFYVVRQKAINTLRFLLEAGVDANAKNRFNETPLHIAAYIGDAELTRILITHGSDVNAENTRQQTPIMLAAQKGDLETVNLLLKHNASLTQTDNLGCHVLMYAIKSKKLKVVDALIDADAPVHNLNAKKESIMHIVSAYGLPSILKRLLSMGVNPYQKNIYHQTPLHYAVLEPMEVILDYLLEAGLNSYDKDYFGESPYDRAEAQNYTIAITKFTRIKTDPYYETKLTYPCHHALRFNHYEQALALIEQVDVNQKDQFGNTPLFYALMLKDHLLVENLLKKNVSLKAIDAYQRDAFLYPILENDVALLKRLLSYEPNPKLDKLTKDFLAKSTQTSIKTLFQ